MFNMMYQQINDAGYNLFLTSKKKPRIYQFTNLKWCIKAKEPYKTPF